MKKIEIRIEKGAFVAEIRFSRRETLFSEAYATVQKMASAIGAEVSQTGFCHDCAELRELRGWRYEPDVRLCESCYDNRDAEEDGND